MFWFVLLRKGSLLGLANTFIFGGYAVSSDPTANESGLEEAYILCSFSNESCNFRLLADTLVGLQTGLGCYLGLASYPISDELAAILSDLSDWNETASSASAAGDCDAL